MKAKVIGTRTLNFTATNGDEIKGTQIFVTYSSDGVNGEQADKVFVPDKSKVVLPNFIFGKSYDFVYDGFGRKQSLVKIEPAF